MTEDAGEGVDGRRRAATGGDRVGGGWGEGGRERGNGSWEQLI